MMSDTVDMSCGSDDSIDVLTNTLWRAELLSKSYHLYGVIVGSSIKTGNPSVASPSISALRECMRSHANQDN